jgi:hypothetical protein
LIQASSSVPYNPPVGGNRKLLPKQLSTASPQGNMQGSTAFNMLDNNTGTTWRSQGEAEPTIIIDLRKEYDIEKIVIKWADTNVARTIDVSTSRLDPYTLGKGSNFVPGNPTVFPLDPTVQLPGPGAVNMPQLTGASSDRCKRGVVDEVSFASNTETFTTVRLVQIRLRDLCNPTVLKLVKFN